MADHIEALTPPFESIWASYDAAPYVLPAEDVRAWARVKAEVLVSTLSTGDVERYGREHQTAEEEGSLLFPADAYRMHGIVADACSDAITPSSTKPRPMTLDVVAWAGDVASHMDLLHGWPRDAFQAAVAESSRLFPGYDGANIVLFLAMRTRRMGMKQSSA